MKILHENISESFHFCFENVFLSNKLKYFFYFWRYIKQHWKIPLHYIGEVDHLTPIFLLMRNIFMIVLYIGEYSTNKVLIIIRITLLLLCGFLSGALVAGDLVYLSNIVTFLIRFSTSFIFPKHSMIWG